MTNVQIVPNSTTGTLTIEPAGTRCSIELYADEVAALRAHFVAERDAVLGRWRWPENPDYVVYPPRSSTRTGKRTVLVVNEANASGLHIAENLPYDASEYRAAAAHAYFAAHPENQPWHDAKPGEAWVLTLDGEDEPAVAGYIRLATLGFWLSGGTTLQPDDPGITAGRRIYAAEEEA